MPEHLVVFIHGFLGRPAHVKYVHDQIKRVGDDRVETFISQSNAFGNSLDGIDVCAERTLIEVEEELAQLKKKDIIITKFSVVGYSMGGLVARYLIGRMLQKGMFETLEPVNIVTIATPHLGVRKPAHHVANNVFNWLSSNMVSHSGEQMSLSDICQRDLPLLVYMVQKDTVFYKALTLFRRRILYANSVLDRTVRYTTGSISAHNPYRTNPDLGEPLEDYPHVLRKSASTWSDGEVSFDILADLNEVKTVADIVEQSIEDEKNKLIESPPPVPKAPEQTLLEYSFGMMKYVAIAIPTSIVVIPATAIAFMVVGALGMTSRTRVFFGLSHQQASTADVESLLSKEESAKKTETVTKDEKEQRKVMLQNLNSVEWIKHDVKITTFPNSHGPIVSRADTLFMFYTMIVDPMNHLAETQFLYE